MKSVAATLMKAAENGWRVIVLRDPKHKEGPFYKIENMWIDFVFKEEALFNAVWEKDVGFCSAQ